MEKPVLISDPNLKRALRPSPNWVAALFVLAALVLELVADAHFGTTPLQTVLLFELLLYAAAASIWITNRMHPELSRVLTVLLSALLIGTGVIWLNIPGFLVFTPITVLIAAVLLNLRSGLLVAIGETILLVLLAKLIPNSGDTTIIASVIASVWIAFGTIIAFYLPVYDMSDWFGTYFHQAQNALEETRNRKAELEQVLDDLAQANRELALLNERLVGMRHAAEDAHQAKAAFVAKISHEFRTPLNMIIGLIDTLTETPEVYGEELPPMLRQDLEIVHRNSTHLAGMINDVLDLSQTETGRLQLHMEWANLADDIDRALTVVHPLLKKKNLRLQMDIPHHLPHIYYDRTRIRQVILNLVSNAARYTEQGGIVLRAEQQNGYVQVSVSDTGPGISAKHAQRIFEPFYRGGIEETKQDKNGGSGLGLSISKQLVTIHHGKIWLDSQPGEGSTFSFSLPISPAKKLTVDPKNLVREDWAFLERANWPKLPHLPFKQRIIICDETGVLHPLFTNNFSEIEFLETGNLDQTVETLQHCPAHAVIFNTASPEGLTDLMQTARAAITDTPLIGCTFPPKINQAVNSGAVDYLVKPVRRSALQEAINKISPRPKRILVVDDNPDIRQLFVRMLRTTDAVIETIVASSGEEGLQQMRRTHPDLILLDVIMPDMDGWQVLKQKGEEEEIRDIPVIVVSAEDQLRQPMSSDMIIITTAQGISANNLLNGSLKFSSILLPSEQEPDQVLE